jgi:hypothetical protein
MQEITDLQATAPLNPPMPRSTIGMRTVVHNLPPITQFTSYHPDPNINFHGSGGPRAGTLPKCLRPESRFQRASTRWRLEIDKLTVWPPIELRRILFTTLMITVTIFVFSAAVTV